MKKAIDAASCLTLVFILAHAPLGWAEMFEFKKLLNGTVTDVRPDSITLAPSKTENIENKTVDVKINEKTELKDFGALNNLKKGDGVYVKYIDELGEKTAVEISKTAEAAMTK